MTGKAVGVDKTPHLSLLPDIDIARPNEQARRDFALRLQKSSAAIARWPATDTAVPGIPPVMAATLLLPTTSLAAASVAVPGARVVSARAGCAMARTEALANAIATAEIALADRHYTTAQPTELIAQFLPRGDAAPTLIHLSRSPDGGIAIQLRTVQHRSIDATALSKALRQRGLRLARLGIAPPA